MVFLLWRGFGTLLAEPCCWRTKTRWPTAGGSGWAPVSTRSWNGTSDAHVARAEVIVATASFMLKGYIAPGVTCAERYFVHSQNAGSRWPRCVRKRRRGAGSSLSC